MGQIRKRGEIYWIRYGNGAGQTIRESTCGTSLKKAEDLLTLSEGSRENPFVCANVSRLRHEVGWRPAIDVMARLDETIRWWQSQAPSQVPA